MKIKDLLKEIKGVFKAPIKQYYLGKIIFGTPYFYPLNFCTTIISIRKLKLRSSEDSKRFIGMYSYLKNDKQTKFSNIPMVRRAKNSIIKIFNNYYFVTIGWPIKIDSTVLGWKEKYDSFVFEWVPSFCVFFFKWQFCIHWTAPVDRDDYLYYEMILQWLFKCNKDIKKAEETWGWVDYETRQSTWNKKYLL
ncbi:MAG: hypothetical protein PF569_01830 [Candidatus Woesearchaeota archaeon]|jgi:hypothetical protein|nr:hypothetical protein [Candidatus Woesearchaeota archaeon]